MLFDIPLSKTSCTWYVPDISVIFVPITRRGSSSSWRPTSYGSTVCWRRRLSNTSVTLRDATSSRYLTPSLLNTTKECTPKRQQRQHAPYAEPGFLHRLLIGNYLLALFLDRVQIVFDDEFKWPFFVETPRPTRTKKNLKKENDIYSLFSFFV